MIQSATKGGVYRLARLCVSLAAAIVLAYLESLLPPLYLGIRLGTANIVTLTAIALFGFRDALFISISRPVAVAFLSGAVSALPYSFCGSVASCVFMWLFSKIRVFSSVGVSVIGAVTHVSAQIAFFALFLKTASVLYMLPWLVMLSVVAGCVTGWCANKIIKLIGATPKI